MDSFTTIIQKFGSKGEKTGWTYIHIPAHIAGEIKPGFKASFRVKGTLDNFSIERTALIPMGEGDFILPINNAMRKGTGKKEGAMLTVALKEDERPLELSSDLLECLHDAPKALDYFKTLAIGHQNYFSKWVESAKTIETKSQRITKAVQSLSMGMGYGEMMRYFKEMKDAQ